MSHAAQTRVTVTAVPLPSASDLALSTTQLATMVVVRAVGGIDLSNAMRWRDALHQAMNVDLPELVIDLDQCTFIDSAGLGVLVSTHRWARHRRRTLRVVTGQPRLLRLLALTGLDRVLAIEGHGIRPTEAPAIPEQARARP